MVPENEPMGAATVGGTGKINQKESRKITCSDSGKKNRKGPAKIPRTRSMNGNL